MIKENNVMNRAISVFLAVSMLVTSFFNSLAMAYAETSAYEDNIGCTAVFNTEVYNYFPVTNDPTNSDADQPSITLEDIGEDFKVIITEYYIQDNELPTLWYKVEAAPGYDSPEMLIQYPWVLQNYLGEYADPCDSLIIEKIEEDNITVFDEEGNEVGKKIELPQFEKIKLIGASSMTGDVGYQWQIFIDDMWIDIYGEDEAEFTLSFGVIASVLDENYEAHLRLVTKKSSKVVEGDAITVTLIPYVEEDEPVEEENPVGYEISILNDNEEITEVTSENDDYENNPIENGTKELNEEKPTSESEETNEQKTDDSSESTTNNETEIKEEADAGVDDSVNEEETSSSETTSDEENVVEPTSESEETNEQKTDDSSELATNNETEIKEETDAGIDDSLNEEESTSAEEKDESLLGAFLSMFSMTAYAVNEEEELAPVEEETETDKVTITVKYVYGSNNQPVDTDTVYEIQKGTNLDQTLTLPVMEGYDAYLESDTTKIFTTYSLNLTNVTEDTVITFKYWPAKVNYTVIYYWQNAEDDDYTEHERLTMIGFTGSDTTVEEKEYNGFYRLLYEKVPIASDGSTVIEVYYDRLYYKMIFNLDGGYGVQPIYARYGTPITVSNPTKAGYNFIGWDNITNGSGDGSADRLPDEVPPYHSEYKAIWEANDTAKVTVVYWGENADDEEYSYLSDYTQEIYAKPGTVINYGTDNLICSLDAHTHNLEQNCYQLVCDQESHIHSDSECKLDCTHVHTIECYQTTSLYNLKETTKPDENLTDTGNGIYTYTTQGWGTTTHYYLKINNTWYCAFGSITGTKKDNQQISLSCRHSHTDACYMCEKSEIKHVHSVASGCYELICSVTEHTHTDSCYLNDNKLDSNLWIFKRSDTVTVEADGSTVMNVYYDRVSYNVEFHKNQSCTNEYTNLRITAKWGENILDKWPTYNGSSSWLVEDKSNTWQNSIQVMPVGGAKFWGPKTGEDSYKATYYVEALPGDSDTFVYNGVTYKYHHEDISVSSGNVTEEEQYEIEGFTYKEGTKIGSSYNNAKFYYTRNKYTLEFNNGEESVKKESVLYEQSLSSYDFTPEAPSFYEPGSVEFTGWYQNPECTGEEYILSEHTMPANNLILYAKWVHVTHTVRFYLDKTIERTDGNVYTAKVDGEKIKYKYDVPHGSAVQNPYTPPGDPEKGQYIFIGWFYEDDNGKEQMWDFENTTVTSDVDIYAKWSSHSLVTYEVKFVYKDGDKEIEIAEPITGSALGGNSKTFEAKGNDQLYADYHEGYFPTTQSHTIVMDLDNPNNNTYTFYYTKVEAVPYTVYYVTDTQNEDNSLSEIELNGKIYYSVADTKSVEDNKKAIVTETYAKVSGYLPDTYQQTLIINPNGKNEIIFYYTKDDKNGMYVVHYWTENLDRTTYSEHSTFEGRGEVGAVVNATIKNIENFTHDDSVSGTLLSGTISKDEVLELNVYYKRNCYSYKVQYLEENTNKPLADEKIVKNNKWESTVTEEAISITDFALVGDDKKSIQIKKDGDTPTVNIITFYYTENKVTIKYEVAEGEGIVTPGEESVKISNGIANGSTATAKDGHKFVGWYMEKVCTTLLSTDAHFVPTKNDGEKWDATIYYAKFEPDKASLTISKSGAEEIDENQTFIFSVTGVDEKTSGIDLQVVIKGNESVTINDLPIGEYKVTEETGWSWRYTPSENNKTLVLNPSEKNEIPFVNDRTKKNWLNGAAYRENLFTIKDEEEAVNE